MTATKSSNYIYTIEFEKFFNLNNIYIPSIEDLLDTEEINLYYELLNSFLGLCNKIMKKKNFI